MKKNTDSKPTERKTHCRSHVPSWWVAFSMSFDYCVHFAKRAHRCHGIHRTVECHFQCFQRWDFGATDEWPCFSSGCLASDEYDPLALQRQTQICRTLHVWPVWLILHGTISCGFCRLPSPVKNSTYMFRDSCLKQAVQDRQIIITTCTWLEVLHSRAVQGRDLSKMLSNNVL